jgi:hypothetical protein
MTPDKLAEIEKYTQSIAQILYEEAKLTAPEQLQSLAGIEVTVRDQILQHVSPKIGVFLSAKLQAQSKAEAEG